MNEEITFEPLDKFYLVLKPYLAFITFNQVFWNMWMCESNIYLNVIMIYVWMHVKRYDGIYYLLPLLFPL